ncbi:MAG: 2-amino-4-hydroxy-6-hydroxymethyldihydropteridine diphosphokinase [Alkalinema sp. RU_4_3]|nr:2-amino-4-hydroxy-6-hydroxymethyldihydropteridine diphosphokinase [Alkalinema sp. RU_4_3]
MQHTAAIALGSNLGDSLLTLNTAVAHLNGLADLRVLACSSWYRTAPIGPPQPDYLNGCLLLATGLTPQTLMQQLLSVETHFGRERRERWGARTLDLDLLLFDDVVVCHPDLTIPHPRMNDRAFVLVPLAEIAADWIDPTTGRAIAHQAATIDRTGVTLFCQNALFIKQS